MFKVPKQLGWESVSNYDKHGLPDEYKVNWIDNDENLTADQAMEWFDVCSLEEKYVDKIMNFEEFQLHRNNFYSNLQPLHPIKK